MAPVGKLCQVHHRRRIRCPKNPVMDLGWNRSNAHGIGGRTLPNPAQQRWIWSGISAHGTNGGILPDPNLTAARRRARSVVAARGPPGTNGTWELQPEEAATAQSAVLAIVPVFCAMGLLGILVCNLLKKKGYHCTAHKEHEHSTSGEPQSHAPNILGVPLVAVEPQVEG